MGGGNEAVQYPQILLSAEEKLNSAKSKYWITYSELNQFTYTSLLTGFTLLAGLSTHPLTVLTVLQQSKSNIVKGIDSHSSLQALREASKQIGFRGLVRGWAPVAFLGIPAQVTYVSIQEGSREMFQKIVKGSIKDASPTFTDILQSIASSIVANVASLIPYVPGEVLTSRMIIERKGLGTINMALQIWKENGVRGFYRGFSSSFATHFLYSANWWWLYSVCRREGCKLDVLKDNPFLLDSFAGTIAGVVATCVAHPVDTLKTRIMTTRGSYRDSSLPTVLRKVLSTEGPQALLHGLKASAYHAAFHSAIFALSYEIIKRNSTMGSPREH